MLDLKTVSAVENCPEAVSDVSGNKATATDGGVRSRAEAGCGKSERPERKPGFFSGPGSRMA